MHSVPDLCRTVDNFWKCEICGKSLRFADLEFILAFIALGHNCLKCNRTLLERSDNGG